MLVEETGKIVYLRALDLNWVVRKAAEAMVTPPITFTLDDTRSTLHSKQGPVFGKLVRSEHPPEPTTTEEK